MDFKKYYSYQDFALVPQYSDIDSRKQVDTSVELGGIFKLKNPIIAANMDTICGYDMALEMGKLGGLGILHRYQDPDEIATSVKRLKSNKVYAVPSIGIKPGDFEKALAYMDAGADAICIDVAHAHHKRVFEIAEMLVSRKVPLIVGNVITAEAVQDLSDIGVKIIKVGIGGGCLAAGSRVLMSDGTYKNIENIKLHDWVINANGKPVEVIGTQFSGFKDVLSVRNNKFHESLLVTSDHKFWVGDLNSVSSSTFQSSGWSKMLHKTTKLGETKIKWKPIGQCKQDILLFPKRMDLSRAPKTFSVDLQDFAVRKGFLKDRVKNTVLKPSYGLGYIFGTFLGDGCSSYRHFTRQDNGAFSSGAYIGWSFGLEERGIADKLSFFIKEIFGLEPLVEATDKIISVRFNLQPLSLLLGDFGKKTEKKLPEYLWCVDPEYLAGLWHGLIDSDGYVNKNLKRPGITNTSKYIIELFSIINYILNGQLPGIVVNAPTAGNLKDCNIENCHTSWSARDVESPLEQNSVYDWSFVKNLETVPLTTKVATYDIQVDDETNSFIANNMIVHNSNCSTRVVTGHGIPTMSALMEIYQTGFECSIIADGGITCSGDIVKALAAGADAVMIGSLLAGCDECPQIGEEREDGKRVYRGMASMEARQDFNGKISVDNYTPEGVSRLVKPKGPVKTVIQNLVGGIQSGCSYTGASNLTELKEMAEFIRVSNSGYIEGTPHGLNKD